MKTNTRNKLLEYLEINGPTGPSKIALALSISKQMTHRHIKSLLKSNDIFKEGDPPKAIYGILNK